MDNQEAIRLIRNLSTMCEFTDAYGEPIDSDAYYEAVDIAISALQVQDAPDTNVGTMISRQAAIDEIEYELEMINSALDSITLDFNARERLRQRRGEAREILNSIQQLPSAQPDQNVLEQEYLKGWEDGRKNLLEYISRLLSLPSVQPDWNELTVICDNCGHAIHVKRITNER